MPAAPLPPDETSRLQRLHELVVLDSAPEPLFDELARLASQLCGTPIALLSLVDAERQWFKANVGLPGVNETPRDQAFCAHAILEHEPLEVHDAAADPRFADNPLVLAEPHIRFYAGVPLALADGQRMGTLCVIDREPRRLDSGQLQALRSLARVAAEALEMRRALITRSVAVGAREGRASADSMLLREAHFRALVDEQVDLISLARPDGQLVYVNNAYVHHLRRSREALVGSNLFDLIPLDVRETVRDRIAGVLATGVAASSDNPWLLPDGSERVVDWTNTVQRDLDGQALLQSVGRDVTVQRQTEQALRLSEARLARTEAMARVGGWELDLQTQALHWSAETRRIHGVPADFVPSRDRVFSRYEPEARAELDAAANLAVATGQGWDLELPLRSADGRRLWVRSLGEVEVVDGVARRLVGTLQDITDRKRLQHKLAEGEQFVRTITDNLPVRIAYVDSELRYRFVNRLSCERFGLPREQIIGRTREELTGLGLEPELQSRVLALEGGQSQRYEIEERLPGTTRRIEVHLIPDLDATGGRPRGHYSIGLDITERSAAMAAMQTLTTVFDATPDLVVQADRRGAISYMNPAARRVTGLMQDDPLVGRNVAEFNTHETNRLFATTIMPAVAAQGWWQGEVTVYAAGQRVLPVSYLVIGHRDPAGNIGRYSAVMRDISAEVAAKQLLQQQTSALAAVVEAIPALVVVVDGEGRFRGINRAFERWSGYSRDQLIGQSFEDLLGPQADERGRSRVAQVLAGEAVAYTQAFVSGQFSNHLSVSLVPLRLDNGLVDGFVALAQDVTQQREEAVRLLDLAQRDTLTGLLNRSGLQQYLGLQQATIGGGRVALLCIDLDHFKPVNDRHGHPVGDRLLQAVAQRLKGQVRPTDAVARLGGDEFAIVLSGVREMAHALVVADKVVGAARQPFEVDGLVLDIGASVGVALGTGADWNELLARADAQLYAAKQAGRGRRRAEGPADAT